MVTQYNCQIGNLKEKLIELNSQMFKEKSSKINPTAENCSTFLYSNFWHEKSLLKAIHKELHGIDREQNSLTTVFNDQFRKIMSDYVYFSTMSHKKLDTIIWIEKLC